MFLFGWKRKFGKYVYGFLKSLWLENLSECPMNNERWQRNSNTRCEKPESMISAVFTSQTTEVWTSVKCQCNTFNLLAAIANNNDLMTYHYHRSAPREGVRTVRT